MKFVAQEGARAGKAHSKIEVIQELTVVSWIGASMGKGLRIRQANGTGW